MPQIRPEKYTDSLGRPISGAAIYVYEVGKAYTDPGALLALTDAENGAAVANPFYTDSEGFPINGVGGARINPVVSQQQWGVYGVSDFGNGIPVYDLPVQEADVEAATAGGTVDATFNNFTDTLSQDLTEYDFIFIKSQSGPNWELTTAGPDKSFYAHATGGAAGTPSTGTPDLFYDVNGKEFAMSAISSVPYLTYEDTDIVTMAGSVTLNDNVTWITITDLNNPDTTEGLYEYEFTVTVDLPTYVNQKAFIVRERHSDGTALDSIDSVRQIASAVQIGLTTTAGLAPFQITDSDADQFEPIPHTSIGGAYYYPISLKGRLRQASGKAATIQFLRTGSVVAGNDPRVLIDGQARFKKLSS